jgi:ADP-ribose pyrophosphatase YjhB (NUDIX family)
VLLVPVDDGLLCVRRGVAPRMGQLALPGGFINAGEAWQTAAVREVEEETGLRLNAENVRLFDALSAPDGTVLIFGVSEGVGLNQLPPFAPTSETSERVVIAAPIELAFPLHTRVMQAYFAARR